MAPPAQELLLRIADTKDYAEYICEFLGNIKCYSVVMIGTLSLTRHQILASFAEFVTARLKSSPSILPQAHHLIVIVASSVLNQFISDCRGDSFNDASSPSHTPVKIATPEPELKRRSSSSSASSPTKKSPPPPIKKPKMLDAAKLLHLNVAHPKFWQYLIAFASLLDPAHAPELCCPGCGNMKSVCNPYNFYSHVATMHSGVSTEVPTTTPMAAPEFPPPGDPCHADLSRLPECAFTHIPLPWLAAVPVTSLPPGIQTRVYAYTTAPTAPSGAVAVSTPSLLLPHGDTGDDGFEAALDDTFVPLLRRE